MKKVLLSIGLVCMSLLVKAQDAELPKLTYQSTAIGMGNASVYDTYLSPLKYTGPNYALMYEQINMTGLLQRKVAMQHLFNLDIMNTTNRSGTAKNYAGRLSYANGLYYRFDPLRRLQFFAGFQTTAQLALMYNTRNGNNPVNVKADVGFNLSGMASYRFQVLGQPLWLRYQLNIPFMGVMFGVDYGQSFYEIGEGDRSNLVHFSFWNNRMAAQNLFTVEAPFKCCTVRLTYENWVYETKVNHLDTHLANNTFYVGLSKEFYVVSGKKANQNKYRHVFE